MKMRNIIVLVSGKSKSGKDVFGKVAKELMGDVVLVTNFAQTYRDTLYSVGWDNDIKDEAYRYAMLSMGKLMNKYWEGVSFPAKTVSNRINGSIDARVRQKSEETTLLTVVTDLRFQHELDAMTEIWENKAEIYLVRVHRPDFDNGMPEFARNSSSECELDGHLFDYEITNKGSLKEYEEKVREVIRDILL